MEEALDGAGSPSLRTKLKKNIFSKHETGDDVASGKGEEGGSVRKRLD